MAAVLHQDYFVNVSVTRGNKYKLLSHGFHYDFRKFSFAAHTVNVLNSLQNAVDVMLFKSQLDKFWADQKVLFDWTDDTNVTGNKSEYTIK